MQRSIIISMTARTPLKVVSLCCLLGDAATAFRLGPTRGKAPLVNTGSFQAPLKFAQDYYPTIPLRFPHLNNLCLNFSLDTGSSINAIDATVAHYLSLPRVGQTTVSALGGTFPADVYQLVVALGGDHASSEVETLFPDLTAAAFLATNRPTNGLLGSPFFDSFAGGVDFDWHGTRSNHDLPSVRFYHEELVDLDDDEDAMTRVSILRSDNGLFFLNLNMNGVDLPALLDTGSPITVLNPQAARLANVDIVDEC